MTRHERNRPHPVPSEEPVTLTARDPGDIVALIPRVMGFRPTRSLVMVCIGGVGLHARVDLPADGVATEEWDAAVDSLLAPAVHHCLPRVMLVLYTGRAAWSERVAPDLLRRFEDSGVAVVDIVRVDEGSWFPILAPTPAQRRHGTRCDDRTHPWILDSLVEGEVIHESRDELRHSLDLDQGLADDVLEAVLDELAGRAERIDRGETPHQIFSARQERLWLGEFIDDHAVLPPPVLESGQVARLLIDCLDVAVRDVVWSRLDRGNAQAHQQFWLSVVRRAIDFWGATPAAFLALASWLKGDGAMAWCAVDRCLADEPDHPLALCVAALLEGAVRPDAWEELRDDVLGRAG